MHGFDTKLRRGALRLAGTGLGAMALVTAGRVFAPHPAAAANTPSLGLIVKTLSNPYFVAMGSAAQAEATKKHVELTYEAGKYDGDNATQISELDDLVTRGVKTIACLYDSLMRG